MIILGKITHSSKLENVGGNTGREAISERRISIELFMVIFHTYWVKN